MQTVTNQARRTLAFVIETDYPELNSSEADTLFALSLDAAADGGFFRLDRSEARFITGACLPRAIEEEEVR